MRVRTNLAAAMATLILPAVIAGAQVNTSAPLGKTSRTDSVGQLPDAPTPRPRKDATPSSPELRPLPLRMSSATPLGVPGFGFFGHAQCDDSGNLYFRAGNILNASRVVRLSSKSSDVLSYALPPDFVNFYAFQASRDGQLDLLIRLPDGLYVLTYRDASSEPKRTRLEAPEAVEPANFAVWSSGAVVLSGNYGSQADKLRGKPYAAEFAPSGKLLRLLGTNAAEADFSGKTVPRAAEAAAGFDDAGYLYFIAGDEVLVMSESGEIARRFKPPLPADGFRMTKLEVAKAQLAIWFHQSSSKSGIQIKTYFEILDPVSGEVRRSYEPDPELGPAALCFTGDSFLFLGRTQGRWQILTADVR